MRESVRPHLQPPCMRFYVTEHFKAVECQSKQDTQVTVMCFPKGRKALSASLAFSICSEEKTRIDAF